MECIQLTFGHADRLRYVVGALRDQFPTAQRRYWAPATEAPRADLCLDAASVWYSDRAQVEHCLIISGEAALVRQAVAALATASGRQRAEAGSGED